MVAVIRMLQKALSPDKWKDIHHRQSNLHWRQHDYRTAGLHGASDSLQQFRCMAIKNHNFGLKFCSNTNDPTENKKDQMKSEKLQMFKIDYQNRSGTRIKSYWNREKQLIIQNNVYKGNMKMIHEPYKQSLPAFINLFKNSSDQKDNSRHKRERSKAAIQQVQRRKLKKQ